MVIDQIKTIEEIDAFRQQQYQRNYKCVAGLWEGECIKNSYVSQVLLDLL